MQLIYAHTNTTVKRDIRPRIGPPTPLRYRAPMEQLIAPGQIYRIRTAARLTQAEFGEKVGASQGAVSKWESGRDNPTYEHLEAIAEFDGKTFEELTGRSRPAGAASVPIVGHIGGGAEIYPYDDYMKGEGFDTEELPPRTAGSLVGVEVRGESMYPAAENGWRLIYSGEQNLIESEVLNRLCVARLADGRMLVKKILKGSQDARYHLMSTNAPLIENAELEWATQVRAIIPR